MKRINILLTLLCLSSLHQANAMNQTAAGSTGTAASVDVKSAVEPKYSAAEQALLTKYANAQTQFDINQVTQKLSIDPRHAPKLAMWLKIKGSPRLSNVFTSQPLGMAIRYVNVPGVKVLLADPRTDITNQEENSNNLITVATNGLSQMDQTDDKKMLKMLLAFGFNPTFKESRVATAQEVVHTFDCVDKDYSKFMGAYLDIAAHCTQAEIVEILAVKAERADRIKLQERKKYHSLKDREIGGMKRKKMVAKKATAQAAAAPATAASFTWPSSKDSKDEKSK